MSNVIPFAVEFDGTDMPMNEITRKARELGWPGIRIDADEITKTNRVTVRRLARSRVFGNPNQ